MSRNHPHYIVKQRDRSVRQIETIKGRRRVWSWGPWRALGRTWILRDEASEFFETKMDIPGLVEYGVFYRGKRVDVDGHLPTYAQEAQIRQIQRDAT